MRTHATVDSDGKPKSSNEGTQFDNSLNLEPPQDSDESTTPLNTTTLDKSATPGCASNRKSSTRSWGILAPPRIRQAQEQSRFFVSEHCAQSIRRQRPKNPPPSGPDILLLGPAVYTENSIKPEMRVNRKSNVYVRVSFQFEQRVSSLRCASSLGRCAPNVYRKMRVQFEQRVYV